MADNKNAERGIIYNYWKSVMNKSKDEGLKYDSIDKYLNSLDNIDIKSRYRKEGDDINAFEAKVAMSLPDLNRINSGNDLNISTTARNLTDIDSYKATSNNYRDSIDKSIVTAGTDKKSYYTDDKLSDIDIAKALYNNVSDESPAGKALDRFIKGKVLDGDEIRAISSLLERQDIIAVSPERISTFIDGVNKRRKDHNISEIDRNKFNDRYANLNASKESIRLREEYLAKNQDIHKKSLYVTEEIATKGFNIRNLLNRLSKVSSLKDFDELEYDILKKLNVAKDISDSDRHYILGLLEAVKNNLLLNGDVSKFDKDRFNDVIKGSIDSLTGFDKSTGVDYKDIWDINNDTYSSIDTVEEALPLLHLYSNLGKNYDKMSDQAKLKYSSILTRLSNNKFISENLKDIVKFKGDGNSLNGIDIDTTNYSGDQLKYITDSIDELRLLIEQSTLRYAMDGSNKLGNVFITNNVDNTITTIDEGMTNET